MATYNDPEAIRMNMKDRVISGEVYVDLSEIIDYNLEGFLDLISERLVGSSLLMDISYKSLRVEPDGMLVLEVSGDPSMVLDDMEAT